MADFNNQVIEEFRANNGVVGGMFEGTPILLLHHVGAKSGKQYVTPLVYRRDGEHYAIFASKAGAPEHPAWYHNLKAGNEVSIEVGTESFPVTVSEAEGEERERIYAAQAADQPQFADYAAKTTRVIPVVLLTPAKA